MRAVGILGMLVRGLRRPRFMRCLLLLPRLVELGDRRRLCLRSAWRGGMPSAAAFAMPSAAFVIVPRPLAVA